MYFQSIRDLGRELGHPPETHTLGARCGARLPDSMLYPLKYLKSNLRDREHTRYSLRAKSDQSCARHASGAAAETPNPAHVIPTADTHQR